MMATHRTAGPTLSLLGGGKIGVAEIEQLYRQLTGKAMTDAERAYAEQAFGSASTASHPPFERQDPEA